MKTENKNPARLQRGRDPLERCTGIVLGEEIFERADEAVDEIEFFSRGDGKTFHAILPEKGRDFFLLEQVPGKGEHARIGVEAGSSPAPGPEFADESSASAGELEDGAIFPVTVSVAIKDRLEKVGLLNCVGV